MGAKIVIVDDDPVVRYLLKECLALHGYEVHALEGGNSGLEYLTAHPADVVFVDMIMPDMTGLDLLKRIKALPDKATTPIILLSANADRKFLDLEPGSRPDRILEKPWDMTLLLATLRELLPHLAS